MIRNDEMAQAGMQALRDAAPTGSRRVMPSDTGFPVTRKTDVKALGGMEAASEEVQHGHNPSDGAAPRVFQEDIKAITTETPTPPPVCIPAEILDVFADPFSNPFNLGDSINCAADVIGTAPFTYEWNGGAGSGATFSIVVSDGNIEGKDETGLGHITVTLLLKNACNEVGDFVSGTFAAQGTPPP